MVKDEALPVLVKTVRPMTVPCTTTGLIKVRYGDDKVAIVNSRCQCMLLLECLRQKCGYLDHKDTLDLISWKSGELQNISDRDYMYEYASSCLTERGTYLLVKVVNDESQPNPQYISLLEHLGDISPDLALKLHDLSKPGARQIRAKWSSIGRKGLETNGSAAGGSRKSGSKFLDLISTAMRNKDVIKKDQDQDTTKLSAKKPGQTKKGKS